MSLRKFIWPFVKKRKGIFLGIVLLDSFTWPLEALLWPYILHIVTDVFTQYEGNRMGAWADLKPPIIAGLSLVLAVEASSRLMGWLMARGVPAVLADIRLAMFDHVQRHSPHYFNERFAGSLGNKITDMTTQLGTIAQYLFWPIIPAIMTPILGTIFLWFVNPIFSVILILWTVIHLSISWYFAKTSTPFEYHHGEARSVLLGKIVDSFTNNFAVNLFYRFREEKEGLFLPQKEERESYTRAMWYVEKMRLVTSLFYVLVGIVGMFGSFIYLWLYGQITTGQVIQVFVTVWGFSAILWAVGSALPAVFQSIGIVKQAYSLMLDPQDVVDAPSSQDLKIGSGAIAFENVSFQYKNGQKLFHNKHVAIRGGEKVGLVGYTGSGKSTFISLILRFHAVQQGKILVDGQDIAHVTLKSLRRQIALIPQDPVLFHRTLWDNIRYGRPEATEAEILQVSKLAHVDQFVKALPGGYNAKVGERGTKLSGGEKQRVAIARAMLTKAPILILDEATSALDSLTENYIQESLEKLMEDRTTIVIAHRLSTLSRMDRLLVFNKGEIVEEGPHASLLAKGGLYAKMWQMQVGGFLPDFQD